jgi:hypothetical protein
LFFAKVPDADLLFTLFEHEAIPLDKAACEVSVVYNALLLAWVFFSEVLGRALLYLPLGGCCGFL